MVYPVLLKYTLTLPGLPQNAWTSFWGQSAQAITRGVWQGCNQTRLVSSCLTVANPVTVGGVLKPCVTACDVRLWFRVLFSATGSSHLKGTWKSGVQGTNICCVRSAVFFLFILLLQKQLLLINVVFTNLRAFSVLNLNMETFTKVQICWNRMFKGYRCPTNMAMLVAGHGQKCYY